MANSFDKETFVQGTFCHVLFQKLHSHDFVAIKIKHKDKDQQNITVCSGKERLQMVSSLSLPN